MSRIIRICPGVGDRKCGAFLSFVNRDTHPTCTRCRGMFAPVTCFVTFVLFGWRLSGNNLYRRVLTMRKKSSPPSGSVPTTPPTSPRAETSSGVSLPGISSSSSSFPLGGQGRQEGSQGAPGVLSGGGGLPPLPLDLGRVREVEVPLGCCLGRAPTSPSPSGAGEVGAARSL